MAAKKKEPDERRQRIWELYGVPTDHQRWCEDVVDFDHRQDSVPCLNGVAVGQHWRNLHTGKVERVESIWLAGLATNTAHSESVEFEVDEDGWRWGHPLNSLVEHWELVEPVESVPETLLIDDEYGKIEVEVMSDPWEAVDPQPYVWPSRDDPGYDEHQICLRVVHARPRGGYDEWKVRGVTFRYYDNHVVLRDGVYLFKLWPRHNEERLPKEIVQDELKARRRKEKPVAPAKRKARVTTKRKKVQTT